MKRWYVIDTEQILCPYCISHILSRWIANAQTPVGQKFIPVEIGWGGERVEALKRFYSGQIAVPTMLVLEEEVFMNRVTFRSKFLTIGAFDDYGTYVFKKELMDITEV